MNNEKLIITKHENQIITSLFHDFELLQVNIEEEDAHSLLGNIYVGKVKNIVKNINAAFVEIADKQICYLSLEKFNKTIYKDGTHKENIKEGDEILVQVTKEDVKSKAPVVTTSISITGKYLVLVHGRTMVGISNKIHDDTKRLRKLIQPFIADNYGFIVRTNALDVDDDILKKEAEFLIKQYKKIKQNGIYRTCFSLIYKAIPAYLCAVRDGFAEYLSEIITDDLILHSEIDDYLNEYQPEDSDKLRLYQDDFSLNRLYNIQNKIADACNEKVWLKSGASLVIQPTEALTVIDVNTGKAIHGKKDVQKTFFNVNAEAAKEAAKQIRLRNLSGIIIVDFINMEAQEDKNKLMELFKSYVKNDPVKTTVIDMTVLNLVEVTRKKVRKPLHEQQKVVTSLIKNVDKR